MLKVFWKFFGTYKEVHQVADIYTTYIGSFFGSRISRIDSNIRLLTDYIDVLIDS